MQVLGSPFRNDPLAEVDEVRSPSFLGLIVGKQLGLAVVVYQRLERRRCRDCNLPVNVESKHVDMVQGFSLTAKFRYGAYGKGPLSPLAIQPAFAPEKFPNVRTAFAVRSSEMPVLIPLRHVHIPFIGARAGEQYLY